MFLSLYGVYFLIAGLFLGLLLPNKTFRSLPKLVQLFFSLSLLFWIISIPIYVFIDKKFLSKENYNG